MLKDKYERDPNIKEYNDFCEDCSGRWIWGKCKTCIHRKKENEIRNLDGTKAKDDPWMRIAWRSDDK